jgi:hypothetical protein
VARSQITELVRDLRVDAERMAATLAAAEGEVRSEQRSIAGLVRRPPRADYLGVADALVQVVLDRAVAAREDGVSS